MQVISTKEAPAAVGPYSQAVLSGGLLFVSGQLGIDPSSGQFGEGFVAQARQVFTNLGAILREAGLDFGNVLKVSVFLQDLNDFALLNEEYAKIFREPYPAREAVQVARLPKDGLIEISLIAAR